MPVDARPAIGLPLFRKTDSSADDLVAALRGEARDAPESGIVEVVNYGRGRRGPDPALGGRGRPADARLHRDAAARSLASGETFYTWQRGIPELREALARYHERIYGKPSRRELLRHRLGHAGDPDRRAA